MEPSASCRPFHEQFGYYAQGVSVSTAVLPLGWSDRMVRWRSDSTGRADAAFLDEHDLVVSKLVAMREKDMVFGQALIEAGFVDVTVLKSRVAELLAELDSRAVARIVSWLAHWA